MYYVYVLKSLLTPRHYIGSAENAAVRLRQHNRKQVRSTKSYAPWKLIYIEGHATKKEARRRELELKNNSWKKKQLFDKIDTEK